jgi:hypothetical protein
MYTVPDWQILLHESCPSNLGHPNFVKNFRNMCLKIKNTESPLENCPSDIANFEKIFNDYENFSLKDNWKFLKSVQKFDNFS